VLRKFLGLLVLGLVAAMPALAQDMPPSRVGRVSFASGELSFRAAGETQWMPAGVNFPVATGGSFQTGAGARAEIEIGPTTIALEGGSELDIVQLDQQATRLGLPQGRIYLQLREFDPHQPVEIDLPQGGVWPLQPGAYDIAPGGPNQPARVAVLDGGARFAGGGVDLTLNGGEMAVLSGSGPVAAHVEPASPGEFDAWARSRGAEPTRLAAPRYVSAQMTGYADLEPYGAWRQSPQYGEVWYPRDVPAGWAPYRDGHWAWVPPWGWTWIDDMPWGFAPSHYGRWAYIDGRWGWAPGAVMPQPVYAPALVAFVSAPAVGFVGAAGPSVGWFPLAPGEVYWPSYTRNVYYIRNVNAANVRNINTVVVRDQGRPPPATGARFANRQFATVVPQNVFAGGHRAAPAALAVPAVALQHAPVNVHPPRIAPTGIAAASAAGAPARADIARPQPPRSGVEPAGPSILGHAARPPTERRHVPAQQTEPSHPAPAGPAAAASAAIPPPRPGVEAARPPIPRGPETQPPAGRLHIPAQQTEPSHPAPGGPAAAARAAIPPPRPGVEAARPPVSGRLETQPPTDRVRVPPPQLAPTHPNGPAAAARATPVAPTLHHPNAPPLRSTPPTPAAALPQPPMPERHAAPASVHPPAPAPIPPRPAPAVSERHAPPMHAPQPPAHAAAPQGRAPAAPTHPAPHAGGKPAEHGKKGEGEK
jgi:hypothetical protein